MAITCVFNQLDQFLVSSYFLHGSIKRQDQQITKNQLRSYKTRNIWKNMTNYSLTKSPIFLNHKNLTHVN